MKIQPAKDTARAPRTRRELLSHLWGVGLCDANVWREGSRYAIRAGRVISATGVRRLGALTFAQWEHLARTAPRTRADVDGSP